MQVSITPKVPGEIANAARDVANRTRKRFENAGWIATGYRAVTILRPDPLAEFVEAGGQSIRQESTANTPVPTDRHPSAPRSRNSALIPWCRANAAPVLAPITISAVAMASAIMQDADSTVTEAGASTRGAPRRGSIV